MNNLYLETLAIVGIMAFAAWIYSLIKHNVNIVDSLWSLMFLAVAAFVFVQFEDQSGRNILLFALVTLWALRLSLHLLVRNYNHPEDRRYQAIRANNEPFSIKSLYIVFGLQALLAWIISAPLMAALSTPGNIPWLDTLAIALWLTGFIFEAVADWQLIRFQRSKDDSKRVLNSGLWRYSRHPNYFGEFCIWWAFYLFAVSSGAWWTLFAPILMTLLLFKVSGVGLMEKGIQSRRPGYAQYIRETNAFFPGPKKRQHSNSGHGSTA